MKKISLVYHCNKIKKIKLYIYSDETATKRESKLILVVVVKQCWGNGSVVSP